MSISNNDAEFRILKLDQYVIPIFDRYPLLTSKYYNLFKQAANIILIKH